MSDETHGTREHIPQAHLTAGVPRTIRGGFRGTLRFFAPSIIVGLVAPFVFPAMRRATGPVARGLVEGALTLGESIKEGVVRAREQMSDMLIEVKAKREKEAAESAAEHKPD
jgi:hypothetical protein